MLEIVKDLCVFPLTKLISRVFKRTKSESFSRNSFSVSCNGIRGRYIYRINDGRVV